ncbi:hypothetical protein [Janthinobacterium sp. PAMC25594]|uniref:hypothetical protein n=1 Tax=Janthinobacterium sp. PAMC25594 TaxID=2861284 RepID=UPI001C639BDB|nr:hypothetical protein [Janthinobacterium sp. PAMC25594]QYG06055.1 hypothetical protein KY494_22635 [Janthinobacterium sp. PAMC25594]
MKRSLSFLLVMGAVCSALPAPASAQTASTACGGSSQPRCQITAPVDQATTDLTRYYTDSISSKNTSSQSLINVVSDRFNWSFIPKIPTTACVNPMIDSPNGSGAVMMDVCSPLATFQTFINGVLAFFCLLGCVQQIRAALAVN